MSTVRFGDFEWDTAKAATNLKKHGVSFPEASEAFDDPHAMDQPDARNPGRFVLVGRSSRARLLFVVYCEITSAAVRIISAPPPHDMSARRTKKSDEPSAESLREMPEVRDWSSARRGRWAGKLRGGNARTLEPELAKAFPDDRAVNAALRAVLDAARAVAKKRRGRAA